MKELRIKDICDKSSSNLKQKDVEGKTGQYPVYGASGIISHIDSYHQEDKYIAIVKDGSGIGRVTFMPAQSSVIGTMQYILPKEGFNINYIGYCLQSLDLSKYKQGAAIPHIYFRDYGERIVKVSEDINEQQAIVDYLDSSFAKIDAMKANAEKALNEAKALFQASLKELLEPKEGWEYNTLDNLCDKINGLWKGKKGPFVNVGVIRNANFTKAFTLSFDNIEYLDVEARQYRTRKLVKGDLIVEKSGGSEKQPVGRTVLFEEEDGEYSFSNFTSVLRIRDRNIITPEFLYIYILHVYLRGDTRKMQKATTGIHNIEFDKFLLIPVPVPPLSEQQSIVDTLDSIKSKVDRLQENFNKISKECDALKQALLRQIFE